MKKIEKLDDLVLVSSNKAPVITFMDKINELIDALNSLIDALEEKE